MLDDANINDQGIDAAGLSTTVEQTIIIKQPEITSTGNGFVWYYAVGEGADDAAAMVTAKADAVNIFKNLDVFTTDYDTTKAALEGLTPAWVIDESTPTVFESGNLYGSSKDVGTILSKLPSLTENGGRVNLAQAIAA